MSIRNSHHFLGEPDHCRSEEASRPSTILLWVFLDTHFREMIRVARLVRDRRGYRPHIVFAGSYPRLDEDLETCRQENIDFEMPRPPAAIPVAPPPPPPTIAPVEAKQLRGLQYVAWRIYHAIAWRLWALPATQWCRKFRHKHLRTPLWFHNLHLIWRRFYLQVSKLSGELDDARCCLDKVRPSLLVFPEDNVEYSTGAFIKAGHERGIPSLVIPYTMANAQEPAESYYAEATHSCRQPLNRLVSAIFRRWRFVYKGRRIVRQPAHSIIIKEWLGTAPPKPWVWNSGRADLIVLENRAAIDYHKQAGLDIERVKMLGSLRLDQLAASKAASRQERERISRQFGFSASRPLFVCAFPPNQCPQDRPGCEFGTYLELCRGWAAALGRIADAELLVVPHPRMTIEEVAELERLGMTVVQGDLVRYIAICDLFVASVSATIALAIACGIPVVNYDVYRYDYSDFKGLDGVMHVDTLQAFGATLERLVADRDFLQGKQAAQRRIMSDWGVLDGQGAARLLAEIDDFVRGAPTTGRDRRAIKAAA